MGSDGTNDQTTVYNNHIGENTQNEDSSDTMSSAANTNEENGKISSPQIPLATNQGTITDVSPVTKLNSWMVGFTSRR